MVDLTGPFRGSAAVAEGLLTRNMLRGPRFRRLFPDVYAPAHLEPHLALRSRAAALLVAGRGVLAGYSAAELLGASCGAAGTAAEVILTRAGCQGYRCRGLRVHRDLLAAADTTQRAGVALTDPVRTAFDLGRWAPTLTEKVAAVDTLAHQHELTAEAVRAVARAHPGAHGGRYLVEQVLPLVDGRAESPMESRIRLALHLGGLPAPAVQHPVVVAGHSFRLDLAYPEFLVAAEYDGIEHRRQNRAHRDLEREALLAGITWRIIRFDAATVLHRPDRVADRTWAELVRRGAPL